MTLSILARPCGGRATRAWPCPNATTKSGAFARLGAQRSTVRLLRAIGEQRIASSSSSSPEFQQPPDLPVVGEDSNLQLTISKPTLLLNHMAERYTSTPRVLMEFVDNAIDDAEAFYEYGADEGALGEGTEAFGAYGRSVEVDVFVCREKRSIRVVDNCRGMPPEVLKRVVLNVGESKKRGVAFLNGQYGFGMQAFRTCCESLTVQTKTSAEDDAMEIQLGRWQMEGFNVRTVPRAESPIKGTGTMVKLENFDEQWMDETFSGQEIAKEIELHFERLLARSGLIVNVFEEDESGRVTALHRCEPFDYSSEALGVIESINTSVVWPSETKNNQDKTTGAAGGAGGAGMVPQKVCIRLCVASQPVSGRISRFFVNGRRIKEVAGTRSFTAYSKRRWTVWAHPNVLGFIDISNQEGTAQGGALQPVITRDEFKRTRYRKKMFEYLIDLCEDKLEKALMFANKAQSDNKLVVLESILTNVLSTVSREDNRRRAEGSEGLDAMGLEPPEGGFAIGGEPPLGAPPAPEKVAEAAQGEDAKAKAKRTDKAPRKRAQSVHQGFNVRLVRETFQDGRRSALIGNTIHVSTEHDDFKARLKQNRQGHDRFDDRICSYLATVIAAHYQDRRYLEHGYQPSDSNQAFQDMIDVYVRLEAKLRRNLPSLIRQMEEIERTKN